VTRTKQLLRTNKPNDGNIKQLSIIADNRIQQQPPIPIVMARAILGGGCFWCVEGAFKQLKGISSALPAYAGDQIQIQLTRKYVREIQVMQKLLR
jgi:hypothetical protein